MSDITTQKDDNKSIYQNNDVFQQSAIQIENKSFSFQRSLSVVLPAFNEELVIASTLNDILSHSMAVSEISRSLSSSPTTRWTGNRGKPSCHRTSFSELFFSACQWQHAEKKRCNPIRLK